jgi:hypothetical protein
VVHTYNPIYSGAEIRRIEVASQPYLQTLYGKNPSQKKKKEKKDWWNGSR